MAIRTDSLTHSNECWAEDAMTACLNLLHRVSPILERETETRLLPFAPAPWILRQCLQTGLVYLENPPEYESFVDEFAWEVTAKQEEARKAAAEPLFHAVRSRFKRFRVALLQRNKVCDLACELVANSRSSDVTVVELGCGDAVNLRRLMAQLPERLQQRCSPFGVELSRKLAEISDEALQAFSGSCLHADALSGLSQFTKNSIDLILLSCFLEHEINPLPLLRSCHERLSAQGHVIIKVPNYNCVGRYVRGERWCGFRWPDHVNYFTPATLQSLVTAAGFRIVRMRMIDQQPLSDNMYAVIRKA